MLHPIEPLPPFTVFIDKRIKDFRARFPRSKALEIHVHPWLVPVLRAEARTLSGCDIEGERLIAVFGQIVVEDRMVTYAEVCERREQHIFDKALAARHLGAITTADLRENF
jgi:hypothetical protein